MRLFFVYNKAGNNRAVVLAEDIEQAMSLGRSALSIFVPGVETVGRVVQIDHTKARAVLVERGCKGMLG
jgi:hypothetical protein